MIGQDPANHVVIDFGAEGQCDLFRNSRTSPTRIPSFHFHNGIDQLLRRALWDRDDARASAKTAGDIPALSAYGEDAGASKA
jgi:hypothetical protein